MLPEIVAGPLVTAYAIAPLEAELADTANAAFPYVCVLMGANASTGTASTVNVAGALVAWPAMLETTTVRLEEPVDVAAGVVYVLDVAPLIGTPPKSHWYVNGPVPEATTENVAVCPVVTVTLAG